MDGLCRCERANHHRAHPLSSEPHMSLLVVKGVQGHDKKEEKIWGSVATGISALCPPVIATGSAEQSITSCLLQTHSAHPTPHWSRSAHCLHAAVADVYISRPVCAQSVFLPRLFCNHIPHFVIFYYPLFGTLIHTDIPLKCAFT